MEMKTEVTKQTKMASYSPCSDLLQNNSLQFSSASIGTLCLNLYQFSFILNAIFPQKISPECCSKIAGLNQTASQMQSDQGLPYLLIVLLNAPC